MFGFTRLVIKIRAEYIHPVIGRSDFTGWRKEFVLFWVSVLLNKFISSRSSNHFN